MFRRRAALVVLFAALLQCAAGALATTISTTLVGNAGNANDSNTGNLYGGVDHDFRIGIDEVTNAQYAEFLNAKAKSDPYGLYSTNMGNSAQFGGITRSGASPNYSFAVIAGMASKPVNYVSWYDAIRFVNWLNNGQGSGDTETGAYTLADATISRQAGALWFLPSENEWYKAAYYSATSHNYSQYPTSNSSTPTAAPPPGTSNTANFNNAVPGPSNVGAYTTTKSFYGAFDMGGNVMEWNETLINGNSRGVRGGAFLNDSYILLSSARGVFSPTDETNFRGFRVASDESIVPAPVYNPDANGDGQVNFIDLGYVLNNYNQPGGHGDGDFDGSGVVDFFDLGILLNNYNQPAPALASAASVPESGTVQMALLGLCGLMTFRACRRAPRARQFRVSCQ